MTHLLIIGGSDAGITAALRVREVDPAVEVTVVVADAFPNYSISGLPFSRVARCLSGRRSPTVPGGDRGVHRGPHR